MNHDDTFFIVMTIVYVAWGIFMYIGGMGYDKYINDSKKFIKYSAKNDRYF